MTPARVLEADPPWPFSDKLPGKKRGAAKHYSTLSVSDIARFPLPRLAVDCWLFLWYVTSMVDEARFVSRAWGFAPTGAELVWVKTTQAGNLVLDPSVDLDWPTKLTFGMGRTTRNCDERVLISRRGRPKVADRGVRSCFFAPVGRHSEKPARFYEVVERLTGPRAVPRVSLFSRAERPGWICYGDEIERRHP